MKGTKATEEQLKEWTDEGYSDKQIAEMTGLQEKTISGYKTKYGLTNSNRLKQEDIEKICRLKESGKSTDEITEEVNRAKSTVYNILKAAGLIPDKSRRVEYPDQEDAFVLHPKNYAVYIREKPVRMNEKYLDDTKRFLQECEQLAAYGNLSMLRD